MYQITIVKNGKKIKDSDILKNKLYQSFINEKRNKIILEQYTK